MFLNLVELVILVETVAAVVRSFGHQAASTSFLSRSVIVHCTRVCSDVVVGISRVRRIDGRRDAISLQRCNEGRTSQIIVTLYGRVVCSIPGVW